MNKVTLFIACAASIFILLQWFVVTSVRRFVFKHYQPISRTSAYSILAALGVLNFLFVRLTFDPEMFTTAEHVRRALAVLFFTYLGWALAVSLFFLVMRALLLILRTPEALKAIWVSLARGSRNITADERGCLNSATGSCEDRSSTGVGPAASDDGPYRPSRRRFLQFAAISGMAVTAGAAVAGVAEAYDDPALEEFDIYSHKLIGLKDPVTFIQITDFHFGMFMGEQQFVELAQRINSLDGDAVFFTGDIYHSALTPVEKSVPILRKFKPRRLGNFAILGNHDFYAGEERSAASITSGGFRLLRNEWLTFREGDATFFLGGIDDPMLNWLTGASFPNFPRFAHAGPKGTDYRIFLSHRPNAFPYAAVERYDLTLSGHVHGGQIILPTPGDKRGWSIASVASRYTHGWYKRGDSTMYLNRGIGLTFVPWRVNCPPEIAVFHLYPAGKGEDRILSRRSGKVPAMVDETDLLQS